MKVLLAVDSLVRGGMERRLLELIKGLKEHQDFSLHLVVFSETIDYPEIYDWDIPLTLLKRVPKRNPLVFYRFYKLCKQWKPDLIHSWGTMSAIWAIPSSVFLRIPLINGNVVDAPENMSFFDKRIFRARLTYPFSTAIVGNSQAGHLAYKVPARKAICIYNGIDLKRISQLKDPTDIKRELEIRSDKVIGMVGSFSKRKDYATFIRAGLLLLENNHDVTLVAVGDGPERSKIQNMVPSERSATFIFTGMRPDVESVINIFDIGVLATNTNTHGEGVSNVIIEYMALRKPVIATTGGGTNEIVDHDKSGYLIAPDSAEELADALERLLRNDPLASQMGQAGSEIVQSRFNLERMTAEYMALYRRLSGPSD